MKTYFLFTVLLIFLSLFSCSKNDNPSATIEVVRTIPTTARVNSTVKVIGKGFKNLLAADSSAQFKLFIADVRCDVAVINDTLLEVFVPANAKSGTVCVEWKSKRYCASSPFTISPANGIQNTFQRLPDYPGKKNRPSTMFSINGFVYIGFDDFWKFDIEQHIWQRVADMPEWATRTASFVINGKAYVFGGLTASAGNGANSLYCYDPQTNSWTKKASMPAAGRMDALSFVHNNKAYVLGGHEVYNNPVSQQCWTYDPQTDVWTRLADLPSSVELEGHAYRIGNMFYAPTTSYGTIEFDPATNVWRVLQSGPQTRFAALHSSYRWDNMMYLIQANQVYRVNRRFDGAVITTSFLYPITPGDKQFMLYTSVGEELFFLHINNLTYANEFWEYLPE